VQGYSALPDRDPVLRGAGVRRLVHGELLRGLRAADRVRAMIPQRRSRRQVGCEVWSSSPRRPTSQRITQWARRTPRQAIQSTALYSAPLAGGAATLVLDIPFKIDGAVTDGTAIYFSAYEAASFASSSPTPPQSSLPLPRGLEVNAIALNARTVTRSERARRSITPPPSPSVGENIRSLAWVDFWRATPYRGCGFSVRIARDPAVCALGDWTRGIAVGQVDSAPCLRPDRDPGCALACKFP
jgi:hypothetical protein